MVPTLFLTAFAEQLGYKDTTILNWEKNSTKRLSVANKVAVHLLMGEVLGVSLYLLL